MKTNRKRFQAIWIAVFVILASVMTSISEARYVVAAEEIIEVYDADGLRQAIANSSIDKNLNIKLAGDIVLGSDVFENSTAPFQLREVNVILDLAGHTISANIVSSDLPLFLLEVTGTLTIKDTVGTGGIVSANGGTCIKATAGTLNIEGGSFTNATQCLDVSNTEVNISDGSFVTSDNGSQNAALRISGDNTMVTITGGTFESNYGTIWVTNAVTGGSTLNITGGTITAKENGSASYACYVDGVCDVNISGGTFNLEPASGSDRVGNSLVLGVNATDDNVNISGGTFYGRIARGIEDVSKANYEVFYGNGSSGGILANGYVLTDNTFYLENPDYEMYFTQDEVKVVPGDLIKLNTRRTSIEAEADNSVDWYSLDPISVGTDGRVYANTNSKDIPSVDTNKITDGNTYTFYQWYDTKSNTYESVTDYIKNGYQAGSGTVSLTAGWQAETSSYEGLNSAITNIVVDSILVTEDIELKETVGTFYEDESLRTLDLGGHTISYTYSSADSNTEDVVTGYMGAALELSGQWNIGKGTIHSVNAGCLRIDGVATVDSLNCLAENAPYAAYFDESSLEFVGEEVVTSQIQSGTFQTTAETGHAIYYVSASGNNSAQITDILKGPYISSTSSTPDDEGGIYLDASKLIVSQTPITYIESDADVDMGTYVYGEDISQSEQSVNNKDYMGDITITGISVDNPIFTVEGESESKFIEGGSDSVEYAYSIAVSGIPDVGSHTGTVKVSYEKMDGTAGEYTRTVSLTITPKQLTIANTAVTKTKVYDKTATAQVQAGTLVGTVDGDDVTVTATAAYDSADAGSSKKITVSYTIAGTDKGNYLAPVNEEILDGIINKANGAASVSMPDYHVGETAPSAVIASETNGTTAVTYYYKQKGASDDTYTMTIPAAEGTYTVKAVFAETTNYLAAEAVDDFSISYIATPDNAYTLSGTVGNDNWYKSDVVITPAEGYTISDAEDGTFAATYTVKSTSSPVIYLKNANGAVTKSIQVEEIKIDSVLPQITGVADGGRYSDGTRTAQVSDEHLKSVTLNGKTVSFTGTTATLTMKSSARDYVIVAEDVAGNKTIYKFHVEKTIGAAGVTHLVRGEQYKLGSGSWKVKGDSTVYNGNMNFYVADDGDYEFEQQ